LRVLRGAARSYATDWIGEQAEHSWRSVSHFNQSCLNGNNEKQSSMPAAAPLPQGRCLVRLKEIGERIRDHRRQLGPTATATAEAAGISRVTLHRIEKGTASVTLGALMNVLDA
jgi:response regulator of citrate/malate metabolism